MRTVYILIIALSLIISCGKKDDKGAQTTTSGNTQPDKKQNDNNGNKQNDNKQPDKQNDKKSDKKTGSNEPDYKMPYISKAENMQGWDLVLVCMGSSSKSYHSTSVCKGVHHCASEVKRMSKDDAEKLGRTPCPICIATK
jgi:hypothetical protein